MNQITEKQSILTVLELVFRNIKYSGLESTMKVLKELDDSNNNELKEKILKHTVRMCANNYGVEFDDIMNSSKRGKVKEARRIVWLLLKECADMNNRQLAEIWEVSKQNVGQDLKDVSEIVISKNTFSKQEHEIKLEYERLKESVIIYKNNITDSL